MRRFRQEYCVGRFCFCVATWSRDSTRKKKDPTAVSSTVVACRMYQITARWDDYAFARSPVTPLSNPHNLLLLLVSQSIPINLSILFSYSVFFFWGHRSAKRLFFFASINKWKSKSRVARVQGVGWHTNSSFHWFGTGAMYVVDDVSWLQHPERNPLISDSRCSSCCSIDLFFWYLCWLKNQNEYNLPGQRKFQEIPVQSGRMFCNKKKRID